MHDVLVVICPVKGDRYRYEVWLGEELPALDGEADSLDAAKRKVQTWLEGASGDWGR